MSTADVLVVPVAGRDTTGRAGGVKGTLGVALSKPSLRGADVAPDWADAKVTGTKRKAADNRKG